MRGQASGKASFPLPLHTCSCAIDSSGSLQSMLRCIHLRCTWHVQLRCRRMASLCIEYEEILSRWLNREARVPGKKVSKPTICATMQVPIGSRMKAVESIFKIMATPSGDRQNKSFMLQLMMSDMKPTLQERSQPHPWNNLMTWGWTRRCQSCKQDMCPSTPVTWIFMAWHCLPKAMCWALQINQEQARIFSRHSHIICVMSFKLCLWCRQIIQAHQSVPEGFCPTHSFKNSLAVHTFFVAFQIKRVGSLYNICSLYACHFPCYYAASWLLCGHLQSLK